MSGPADLLEIQRLNSHLYVRLKENVQFGRAAAFRDWLNDFTGGEDCRVVIDATEVMYINVMSLQALGETALFCSRKGGFLFIVNPSPYVRRTIHLSGLRLEIFAGVDDARAEISRRF